MAEIELGRGTTPLPAALHMHSEDGRDQRCVVKLDDTGYHIEALESLTLPSWKASFPWDTVQHLEVEATDGGVAVTIADETPGSYRVELRDTTVPEVEQRLAPYASPEG